MGWGCILFPSSRAQRFLFSSKDTKARIISGASLSPEMKTSGIGRVQSNNWRVLVQLRRMVSYCRQARGRLQPGPADRKGMESGHENRLKSHPVTP